MDRDASPPRHRPFVFVTVGTDHHPFDRVVEWSDRLAARGLEVVVQYGTSRPPSTASGHDYLPIDELEALMRDAAAVVSHGGPATIMQVRDLGVVPIVVARDPSHGEHVDGHQMRFADRLSSIGSIIAVQDFDGFDAAIDRAISEPATVRADARSDRTDAVVATIGDLIETLVATRRGAR
jgi:UDP-N-acetylglucosamine transferase subunit ALG13